MTFRKSSRQTWLSPKKTCTLMVKFNPQDSMEDFETKCTCACITVKICTYSRFITVHSIIIILVYISKTTRTIYSVHIYMCLNINCNTTYRYCMYHIFFHTHCFKPQVILYKGQEARNTRTLILFHLFNRFHGSTCHPKMTVFWIGELAHVMYAAPAQKMTININKKVPV